VRVADLPADIGAGAREAFFEGLSELSGSVDCVRRAGAAFARIPDGEWKVLRARIPGEARRWAQNARDCVTKGLHPAFALMAGTLGRKARKLSPADQERVLREPIEVAITDADGLMKDKRMMLASEMTSEQLDRVFKETAGSTKICTPKEQAAQARAKVKALAIKDSSETKMVIEKPAYLIDRTGVKIKRKSLSFGQFRELVADVAKMETLNSRP